MAFGFETNVEQRRMSGATQREGIDSLNRDSKEGKSRGLFASLLLLLLLFIRMFPIEISVPFACESLTQVHLKTNGRKKRHSFSRRLCKCSPR